MPPPENTFDVVIIGGGPAGTTAGLCCARHGLSAIVLDKDRYPRFRIGESLLPRNFTLLRELGLLDRLKPIPHTRKFGASFAMADADDWTDYFFPPGPNGEEAYAINVERALFDQMLSDAARDAGVEIRQESAVKSIDELVDGQVALTTSTGPVRGRLLLDASGQATVVARHLGTRRPLRDLQRVAYYAHFEGVHRREGRVGGSIHIVMCDEGWFWLIPLDERRTSIGLVVAAATIKAAGIPADRALAWGMARSPLVRRMTERAVPCTRVYSEPHRNLITADFSYQCAPYAGPGYFLVGDAATFVDPIFSTGVCLGMMSAVKAADASNAMLRDHAGAGSLRREYCRYVRGSSAVFFRLVRRFYRHGFRELFLSGSGPMDVHTAVLATLAGHVFPRPVFSQRWRVKLFELLLEIHERRPLAPRRKRFSLINSGPMNSAPPAPIDQPREIVTSR